MSTDNLYLILSFSEIPIVWIVLGCFICAGLIGIIAIIVKQISSPKKNH